MIPTSSPTHQQRSPDGVESPLPAQQSRPEPRSNPGSRPRGPRWRGSDRSHSQRGFRPPTREPRQPPSRGASPSLLEPRRPPPALQRTAVIPAGWNSQKSAVVIIRGIPEKATPWDIRQFFEKYGTVVYVELDDPSRAGVRSAKLRFEPPPTDISFFQHGGCRLVAGGSSTWTRVEFPRSAFEESTLTTPLGNTCPVSLVASPVKLTFGLLAQPTEFMAMKEVHPLGGELGLKLTVDFRRKKLVIHFPLIVGRDRQYYRIDIKFGIIQDIYRVSTDRGGSALVLVIDDAPLFRKKNIDVNGELWADRRVWGEDELWHRAVEVRAESENPRAEPVSLDEKCRTIDLGRWTTYWMDLDEAGAKQWSAVETHLRDWNVNTTLDVGFTQIQGKDTEFWTMLADSFSRTSTGASLNSWNDDLALLGQTAHISLPFDVRYQLEVCLSRGILCEHNIGPEFLEKLLDMSKPGSRDPSRARLILEYAVDEGKRIYNPMNLFEDRAALTYYPSTLHIPKYCALIRKVTVTPTRIYFSTPTVETTNRVIRHYSRVKDFFLRVQFTDELLDGRIRACESDRDDELYTRVYRVLIQGIRMGKWHWKFLAFGNSQIRENGAFFFCQPDGDKDGSISCDSIRQWMGKFTHITSVAKLAARLGQCFSTTRLLHGFSSPRIVKISDVENDGFCFTDGVGKISTLLAHFVSEDWNIRPAPSAFQFRMGGCKGVLVAWPEVKGTEVHIRPSQEKFLAQYNGLEIIRCSQFSCATLNRQTILILSCLGVPDNVFTDIMKEQLANYNAAMTDKNKAMELLTAYVDENMTTTTIASMIRSGFMYTREPFVRTVLQLWRSWSIKALKEKARLIVDKGAFVLGCVDETGTLRGHSKATAGQKVVRQDQLPQIFLQVPDPKDRGAYKVITGLCIVGRNPSLHPGDIRVVEAVDVPQLQHIRDVVVFPLKGDRDVPSMCSGGDLDGDDFFVIWDPKFLPAEWSHPPMNYTAPKPLVETTASISKALASFFVLFMKNDRLPLIAHAHLATADYEPEGARHPKCLQLAQLHSTAVDYVKSGIPAEWNKKLTPHKYPHFMEKPKGKSYHSQSVLGKLYDMIDKQVFDNRENYKLPFDDRILKHFQLENDVLKQARKLKSQYDIAMRRVMGQLEIRTEFEIWTTFVLSRPRVGTDYKVQEKVGREAAGLKKQFRDLCITAAGDRGFTKLGPFVAAMYRVTWEETRIALHEARQPHVLPDGTVGLRRVTARSMPLISFPWLFPDELGRIAAGFEKMPGFEELGGVGGLSAAAAAEPKSSNPSRVDLETARELAAMEYTRTSDGQFIHRGEILHLFRHAGDAGDDEEGYYCDGGVVTPGEMADSESERVDEGGLELVDDGALELAAEEKTSASESPHDLTVLLDLETAADEGRDGSSASVTSETAVSSQGVSSPPPVDTRGGDISAALDLLSSDMDAAFSSSDWLVPLRPSSSSSRRESTEAERQSSPLQGQLPTVDSQASFSPTKSQPSPFSTTTNQPFVLQQQAPTTTETAHSKHGIAGEPITTIQTAEEGADKKVEAEVESVISDSLQSWDQLASQATSEPESLGVLVPLPMESSSATPSSVEETESLDAGPISASSESWGCVTPSSDGLVLNGGQTASVVVAGSGLPQPFAGGKAKPRGCTTPTTSSGSLGTGFLAVAEPVVGIEDEMDESDGEVEYEEAVVEVEAETALERAARLG